jgi:hypothetical protein
MTSRQHQDWINHGKPDSGLALPLQLLANTLAAAGYTVYVYPNDAHLDAEPPEDHTYYSETGWPGTSPKWWRHAIDIMPPPSGSGLPSLTQLGQNIFNARQAGQITWLKYMNWPSDGNLSRAVQDRWEPNHSRGSSSDTGHIHLSSTTGVEVLDASYNPLGTVLTSSPGGPVILGDDDILAIADAVAQWATVKGALPANHIGAGVNLNVLSSKLAALASDVAAVKAAVATPPAVTLSPDQLAQVVASVVAALQGVVPTLAEINTAVDKAVKARLDGATFHTAGS